MKFLKVIGLFLSLVNAEISEEQAAELKKIGKPMYEEPDSDVVLLTDENYDEIIMNSEGVWMLELFQLNCGYCRAMLEDWKLAAKDLKGIVNFGALNNVKQYKISKRFDIAGVPSLYYLGPTLADKKNPRKYNGPRDRASFVKHAMDSLYKSMKPKMRDSKKEGNKEQ